MSSEKGFQVGDKVLFRTNGMFGFMADYKKFYGIVVDLSLGSVSIDVYSKKDDVKCEESILGPWYFYPFEIKHAPTPKLRMGDIVLLNRPEPYTWEAAEEGVSYDTVYGVVMEAGKQISNLILIGKGTKEYANITPGLNRWHYPNRLLRKASKAFIRSQP